jgi:2-keto-4-pentenoate hydratase/2-oxohepta-3-ene-1,7-dioic acid hydratase in catechol pathway
MKFLTLEHGQLGALVDGTVVDLPAAARESGDGLVAATLAALVEAGDGAAVLAWDMAVLAVSEQRASRPYDDVRPLAPIPVPRRNIICLGKNYLEHAREVAAKMNSSDKPPEHPIIFTKATTAVIAPGAPVPSYPGLTRKLDYEAELALIIGTGGRDIAAANAWQHVFGYTAINDISARDMQKNHFQWFRAKSLDGFAPMGPLVVHRSAMAAPEDIEISCTVNGELRQQATLDQLIFDVPTIIETLSSGMTLLPGDIIATGTPAGVGMGFSPPKYLQAGDEMVVEVGGAGALRNPVS